MLMVVKSSVNENKEYAIGCYQIQQKDHAGPSIRGRDEVAW